ncbi:MAG: ThuA domain-containing protein [Sedimentisphaerales bacterium]|nr:ThuA domain-containing protein [Sedimentisphaerales bacterium]
MKRKIQGVLYICLAFTVLLFLTSKGPAKTDNATRLLIVADEQGPMNVLTEEMKQREACTIAYLDQKELPDRIAEYAVVFMYIHGAMTERTEKILIDYARKGGKLIILHHGIASARMNNPAWLQLTGVHMLPRDHPQRPWKVIPNTTYTLINLQPDHFITSYNVNYDHQMKYLSSDAPSLPVQYPAIQFQNTEVFLNQHFTDGRAKHVLFGFHCVDPETGQVHMQDRAGWYKQAGKGWLFYFQPGHRAEDFRNPAYLQILLNCLHWMPDDS